METLKGKYSIDELVNLEATRRGVDPSIIRGMIRTESSGKPGAISNVGARGLMQVMPDTAKYLGFSGNESDLHDPGINIALGVEYFKQLLDQYNGDMSKALSAYNQGPGNLAKKGIVNQDYVDKVQNQSYQKGGKVGVFDRPVSPIRVKPGLDDKAIEAIIEKAMHKVMGHYAVGGQIPGVTPDSLMGNISGIGNKLANFNPNIQAQTGAMEGTAGQLSNFTPIAGPANNTLQGIIAGNSIADVSGATQEAQNAGAQTYNQLTAPQINEQFGAMGLGSSSARTAALAREAGNVATNVGNTSLNAQIGAQENALNRQLGGFSPLLQATGQQLQGLSNAGSLQGQAAGLKLDAANSNAGYKLSGLQSAGNIGLGQAGIVSNERMQGNALNQQAALAGLNTNSGRSSGGAMGNPLSRGISPRDAMVNPLSRINLGARNSKSYNFNGFASGGRVNEADFLSNLLYGRTFEPRNYSPIQSQPVAPQAPRITYVGPSSSANAVNNRPQQQIQGPSIEDLKYRAGLQLLNLANTPEGLPQSVDSFNRYKKTNELKALLSQLNGGGGAASVSFEGVNRSPGLTDIAAAKDMKSFEAGLQGNNAEHIAQFYINQGINPVTGQHFADGGVIDGPSVPPDQVPIMAQGGEGIVPVHVMHELEHSNSSDPLIGKLKGIMGFASGGVVQSQDTMREQNKQKREAAGFASAPGAGPTAADIVEAKVMSDLLTIDPSKLEFPMAGFVKDPYSKKNIDTKTFLKNYPGLLLPGSEGYTPGPVQFKRDPVSGRLTLIPAAPPTTTTVVPEKKQKGGKVGKVMHEFKAGKLHSGSKKGPKVTNRKQAIAIALSEERKQKAGGYATGGQIPTDSPRAMKIKEGLPSNYVFGNDVLNTYDSSPNTGVSSPPVDLDKLMQDENLRQANEDRRLSLYDSLMATSNGTVRSKLKALRDNSATRLKESADRLVQLSQLKVNQELAKAQQDSINQYRQDQVTLGQGRLGVQRGNLDARLAALEAQGVLTGGQGGGTPGVQGNANAVTAQPFTDVSGSQALAGASNHGLIPDLASPNRSRANTVEENLGFNIGDIPGNSPEEIARNGALMQTPTGLAQLVLAGVQGHINITPGMIYQAKKFVEMYQGMPINDPDTANSVALLTKWVTAGGQ